MRTFKKNIRCVCDERSELAILLPELHANLNVGHAAKDFLFLSNMLSIVYGCFTFKHTFFERTDKFSNIYLTSTKLLIN